MKKLADQIADTTSKVPWMAENDGCAANPSAISLLSVDDAPDALSGLGVGGHPLDNEARPDGVLVKPALCDLELTENVIGDFEVLKKRERRKISRRDRRASAILRKKVGTDAHQQRRCARHLMSGHKETIIMTPELGQHSKPAIVMTRTDHERLSALAEARSGKDTAVSDFLLMELDRTDVVDDDEIAVDVVRMGSRLRFTTNLGEDRYVTLVFPGEADISQARISILTPIGAALIGLSAGQSIEWTARDGRSHRLTIQTVAVPA